MTDRIPVSNIPVMCKSDASILKKTIEDLYQNSFDYLYGLQKSGVFFHKFELNLKDLKPAYRFRDLQALNNFKIVIPLECEFIDHSHRELFKRSQFRRTSFTQIDISNNPHIFTRNYMVFIDGFLVNNTELFCEMGKAFLVFDTRKDWDFDTKNIPEAILTVMISHNYSNKSIDTTRETILNNNRFQFLDDPNIVSSKDICPIEETNYISFIKDPAKKNTFYLTETNTVEKEIEGEEKTVLQMYDIDFVNHSNMNLNMFGMKYYYAQSTIRRGELYFQLDVAEMPISTENILLFIEEDRTKRKRLVTSQDLISVELYYPNIYKVVNKSSTEVNVFAIAFYNDEMNMDDYGDPILEYVNYSKLYFSHANDILDKFRVDAIPEFIKNYKPYKFEYDIPTYEDSDVYRFPDFFRMRTLRDSINYNEEYLRTYLRNLIPPSGRNFILDMGTLYLPDLLRDDMLTEGGINVFENPRYLFTFPFTSEEEYNGRKYFIDGELYYPTQRFHDTMTEYLYIDRTEIAADSILEIEKFPWYKKTIDFFVVDSNDIFEYNHKVTDPVVHIDNLQLSIGGRFLRSDEYTVSVSNGVDQFEVSERGYEPIHKIKICILNPELFGLALTMDILFRNYLDQIAVADTRKTIIGTEFEYFGNMNTKNRNFILKSFGMKEYSRSTPTVSVAEKEIISNQLYEIDAREFVFSYKVKRELTSGTTGLGYIMVVTYDDDSTWKYDETLKPVSTLTTDDYETRLIKIIVPQKKMIKNISLVYNIKDTCMGKVKITERKFEKGFSRTGYVEAIEDSVSDNVFPNSTLYYNDRGFAFSDQISIDPYTVYAGMQTFKTTNDYLKEFKIESKEVDRIPIDSTNKKLVFAWHLFIELNHIVGVDFQTKVDFYDNAFKIVKTEIQNYDVDSLGSGIWHRICTNPIDIPTDARYMHTAIIADKPKANMWVTGFSINYGTEPKRFIPSQEELNAGVIPYGAYNNIGEHFRVYKNGKKIPDYLNFIRLAPTQVSAHDGNPNAVIVNTNLVRKVGDIMSYEYTPIRLKQIMYMKKIPKTGIIDMRGIIKKPFDFRWYEVYLNGLKLNEKMVDILTPTRIMIKDTFVKKPIIERVLPTGTFNVSNDVRVGHVVIDRYVGGLYNLEVYEKDLNSDDEYILTKDYSSYNEKMYDILKDQYENMNNYITTEPDMITDQWGEWDLEFAYHIYYWLRGMFIDPNKKQITEETRKFLPTLMDLPENVLLMDPNKIYKVPILFFVDPNRPD